MSLTLLCWGIIYFSSLGVLLILRTLNVFVHLILVLERQAVEAPSCKVLQMYNLTLESSFN